MTRNVQPTRIPGSSRHHGQRYAPYVIPDLSGFRLHRSEYDTMLPIAGPDDGIVDPVDIAAWMNRTIPPPPDRPLTEVSDLDYAIHEDLPEQVDALDVVHTILDCPVDSDGSDNGHYDPDDAAGSAAFRDAAPEARPQWMPGDDPGDIYDVSDASVCDGDNGEDDHEPHSQEEIPETPHSHIPRYDNLEEHVPADLSMTATEFKFALFLSEFQLSRRAWGALCEIITTSPHYDLLRLPKWKPTLMDKFAKQLPRCAMRRKTVALDAAKLPSRALLTEDLVWLDMEGFISKLLVSPLYRQHIYQGMAHFTRYATEFWHTRAWGESIRTTSGNFITNKFGDYILPSDFVRFHCVDDSCKCRRSEDLGAYVVPHLGRVTYCGIDKTGRFSDDHPVTLIAPVFELEDMPVEAAFKFHDIADARPFVRNCGVNELVLVQGNELLIPSEYILEVVDDIRIDYDFDPKENGDYVSPVSRGSVIRYVWNRLELQSTNIHPFIPARLTSPHRAELELKLKSRSDWIRDFTSKESISLPWKLFIDAFGLYRNMYRSMTGVYPLPTFFPDHIANRRSSVTPLTVGLFGLNTSELLNELSHSSYLALGHDMDIGDSRVHVCSFTICFIGDFPQQQDLSGCKDHRALQPCRFCMIPKALRHDLDYNVIEFGRYHSEIISIRDKVKHMRPMARAKKLKDFGLKDEATVANAASRLAPGLDLLRDRPIDAAHSEFTSLVKTVQRILVDEIILKKHHADFVQNFQRFPLPPHFHRVQSPVAHLDSWRMQECTEVSIVMPVLLYYWLSDAHIQPSFLLALQRESQDNKWLFAFADLEGGYMHERYFESEFNAEPLVEFGPKTFPTHLLADRRNSYTTRERIIVLFWNIARSNLLVFGRYPPQLTDASFMNVVYRGRKSLQLLFHAAAHACAPGQKRKGPQRIRELTADLDANDDRMSVASGATDMSQMSLGSHIQANSEINVRALPGKAKTMAYSRLKELPNIHQGLHLWEVARQFGACRMVNTLLGEDQHKKSKLDVMNTNHRLVSETLIQRMNTRKSIDFGFAGALRQTFPRVHEYFQVIADDCPSLVQRFKNDDDDNDDDGKVLVAGDESHIRPLVALTLKQKAVLLRHDPLLNVCYPGKQKLDSEFVKLLMAAYDNDYKLMDVVNFGPKKLRWVRRLSFSTGTGRRICVRLNDFIRTRDNMQLARVDGIFTHRYHRVERVFLVITFLDLAPEESLDRLLRCPIHQIGDNRLIIGLPSVLPSEYWVVQQKDGSYVSLPHDIYTI